MSVDSKMTAIADAIRAKAGTTDKLTLDGMAKAIAALKMDGVSTPTVDANGVLIYAVSPGVDADGVLIVG